MRPLPKKLADKLYAYNNEIDRDLTRRLWPRAGRLKTASAMRAPCLPLAKQQQRSTLLLPLPLRISGSYPRRTYARDNQRQRQSHRGAHGPVHRRRRRTPAQTALAMPFHWFRLGTPRMLQEAAAIMREANARLCMTTAYNRRQLSEPMQEVCYHFELDGCFTT